MCRTGYWPIDACKSAAAGLDDEFPPPEIVIPRYVIDVKKWWAYTKRRAMADVTKKARARYVLELRRVSAMNARARRKWRIAAGIPAAKAEHARLSGQRVAKRFWLQAALHKRGRAPSPWTTPIYLRGD